MVSNTGFDAGAKAIARDNDILLRTYREAEDTDWKRMIETVSATVHDFDILNVKVSIKTQEIPMPVETPIGTGLFKETGEDYAEGGKGGFTVKNLFWGWWDDEAERPRQLGSIEARLDEFSPPAFVEANARLLKVESITIAGIIVVLEYKVPLNVVTGEVFEDSEAKKLEYISVNTGTFNISRIRENYNGVELTQEEWNSVEKKGSQGFLVEDGYDYRINFVGGE